MIVFGEAHLRRILGAYAAYNNESRTHCSLTKDARSIARLSAPALSNGSLSSAAFIIIIAESNFRYTQWAHNCIFVVRCADTRSQPSKGSDQANRSLFDKAKIRRDRLNLVL